MKRAFASAVLLAAWACTTSCWGQEANAKQLSPALQIKLLRDRVATLESEKKVLADRVQHLLSERKQPPGNTKDTRPPPPDPRIGELEAKNAALTKDYTEAENKVRQFADELAATQSALDKAENEVKTTKAELDQALKEISTVEASSSDLQKRLAASEATVESQRRTIADLNRSIADLQRILAESGKPFWPWGAVAVVAAAALGTTLTRRFWTKPVLEPLSVNVKVDDWKPKSALNTGSWTPTFSVRSELIPRSASIRAVREPLVREVRDIQPGAVQ